MEISIDDTVKIIESFAKKARFPVKNFVNDRNLGFIRNFEKAIKLCNGEIITLVDQDDVWIPEKLEIIEKYFSDDPLTDMIFSDAYVVDEKLNPLGYALWESLGINHSNKNFLKTINNLKLF